MKNCLLNSARALAFAAFLVGGASAYAQAESSTTTTTTSNGTVGDLSPTLITVRSSSTAAPVSYTYTKTTTYVDENGNPVSVETVRSGVPVTVYYEQEGNVMTASKVVVHKVTTTAAVPAPMPAPVVETKKTTTTTTTTSGNQ
jgi:hypothetical protein